MTTLLIALLALFMFSLLMQRPIKKQAEEQARLRESLTEGSRVLLTSNIFGTITHVGDEQVIVEIAPGVEVTATKQAVVKLVTPDEEEFEFEDELEQGPDEQAALGQEPLDEQPVAQQTVAQDPFARPDSTDDRSN
ncbi:preprotein translocase subunit YajC [Luteococcus sp. OSA5]|uniref:preprotein translocase subunit YajC n=1 Tax=Luteococcus sp. OSA5 TaxID=3401630 RepID=UPI003B42B49D